MCGCYDSRGRNAWRLLQLLQASQMCPQTHTLFLTSLEDWPRGRKRWSASNYRGKDIRVPEFQAFLPATGAVLWSALQIDVNERRVKGLKATKFNQNKKAKNQEMKPGGGGGESTYIPSKWISHPKKLLSLWDQTLWTELPINVAMKLLSTEKHLG